MIVLARLYGALTSHIYTVWRSSHFHYVDWYGIEAPRVRSTVSTVSMLGEMSTLDGTELIFRIFDLRLWCDSRRKLLTVHRD
jgi:hypothetical protein